MQETLPIHESKSSTIEHLLSEIRELNAELDAALSCTKELEPEAIASFDEGLAKRAMLIDAIRDSCAELDNNAENDVKDRLQKFWNGFRIEMAAGDEKRVALLRKKVDLAAASLRTTQKQKALLQYQRG